MHQLEEKLKTALQIIENAEKSIQENKVNYDAEVEDLYILKEMIKEQMSHENSHHTAR